MRSDTEQPKPVTIQVTDVYALPELEGADDRLYLLVFDGASSSMFQLGGGKETMIGRAAEVDLRLGDGSVSRRHASINVVDGVAVIRDMGSQNGTFVNGERLTSERPLLSGDVISICSASLVFHSGARTRSVRVVIDNDSFRELVDREVERALARHRPFAVLAVGAAFVDVDDAGELDVMTRAIERAMSPIDRLTWSQGGFAYLLLPETDPEAAGRAARSLVTEIADEVTGARVGYACCPRDGSTTDALLSGARAALAAAKEGQVVASEQAFGTILIGERSVIIADEAMSRLYALIERLAATDIPVLVCGETGSGKESAATAVHQFSKRAKRPLLTLNCAALQEQLVESELFGHEKGAYTGALASKPGLLETATGGTVFLDEIGELSPAIQAKLLRVLETGRFTRLGAVDERTVDVRFVAATHRDLRAEVAAGRFREDLYFRLSAATVWLPPLRDRKREIPILAQSFLAAARERAGLPAIELSAEAMQLLGGHRWPGNIRELRNVMEYVAAAERGQVVGGEQIEALLREPSAPARVSREPIAVPPPAVSTSAAGADAARFRPLKDELAELERTRIRQALEVTGGNQTRAAKLLSVPLRTFVSKLEKYGIKQ